MNLFGWFKTTPGNVTVLKDVIWLTRQAKFCGITKAVSQGLVEQGASRGTVLVAHFRDCLEELQRISEAVGSSGHLSVASASSLRGNPGSLSCRESETIEILVGERHPLLSHDESILEFAGSLPCRCYLVHHVSLEDPMMRACCGEWVESVLKKLGMADDEAIESDLVARRIKAAQKKISGQTFSDIPAESAEAWMEHNCPEVWRQSQR